MNYRIKCISTALTLAVFSFTMVACSRDKEKDKQVVSAEKPGKPAERQSLPQPPPKILPVSGKVLEILDTGGFIFVALDWQGKKVWATVPSVALKLGEVISLDHATMIKGFHSKVLNRTFDELIFASSVIGKESRPRVASKGNPNDLVTRRSGALTAGHPPSPAPPKPTAKPAATAEH